MESPSEHVSTSPIFNVTGSEWIDLSVGWGSSLWLRPLDLSLSGLTEGQRLLISTSEPRLELLSKWSRLATLLLFVLASGDFTEYCRRRSMMVFSTKALVECFSAVSCLPNKMNHEAYAPSPVTYVSSGHKKTDCLLHYASATISLMGETARTTKTG